MKTYDELIEAVKLNQNQEAITELAEWFESKGEMFWNGEFYEVKELENSRLFPVYNEVDEDEFKIVGWELKW